MSDVSRLNKKSMCSWKRNNNKHTKASEPTLEELLPNAKLAMNETLHSFLWYLCLYNRTFENVMHFLNLSAPLLAIIVLRHNGDINGGLNNGKQEQTVQSFSPTINYMKTWVRWEWFLVDIIHIFK